MEITPNSIDLDFVAGLFFIVFGFCLITFRQWGAKNAVKLNTALLHFSGTEKQYKVAFIIVGVVFSIIGFLHLFGILHSKPIGL